MTSPTATAEPRWTRRWMMHKDTIARAITKATKEAVAERDSVNDWPCCLFCGYPAPPENPTAFSCAHFMGRAQGGLGIEENILTLCPECHRLYDQSIRRERMRSFFRDYLKSKYLGWDESKLYYRKE